MHHVENYLAADLTQITYEASPTGLLVTMHANYDASVAWQIGCAVDTTTYAPLKHVFAVQARPIAPKTVDRVHGDGVTHSPPLASGYFYGPSPTCACSGVSGNAVSGITKSRYRRRAGSGSW